MDDIEIVTTDDPLEPVDEEIDEEESEEPALSYDEESPNLVEAFMTSKEGEESLKKMVDFVIEQFDAAWESQEPYRSRMANDWKLFAGELPDKVFPWKDCANAHVPIVLENITRLQMRAAGELFRDWSDVVGVLPVGPDDREQADILTRHANWQISEQMPDFKRQMMRGLLLFFMSGDVVCHSYYDPARRKNRHEILTCDDFVVPHVHTTVEPDFSDCPWVAKVLYRYKHELERMRDEWHDVDRVIDGLKPSWDDDPNAPFREEQVAVSGIDSDETQVAPHKLLHWEGWLELPNQVNDRYCKVVLDHKTRNILQLQILEEEDWQDKHRYNKQLDELTMYTAAKSSYDAELAGQAAGLPGPMDPMTGAALMQAPPPMLPAWVDDPAALEDPMFEPEPIRKVPIHMFAHGVCIEPANGPLGLGYGRIQSDYNRAANTALSQFSDAATLANCWSIITSGGEFEGGFSIAPGKVNKAKDVSPAELAKSFIELKPSPANPQLLDLVKLAEEWGQSSMQAPAVLSGESGKSGETYRGISTRVEQATKQLSVVTGKFADFVTQIIKNNAKLNAKFMDEQEVIHVNNHKLGTTDQLTVGRQMYERDYRVTMRSDLRFASQAQRITEADQTLAMVGTFPPLQGNPAFVYQALKESLIARSQEHLVPFLGPPPPMPQFPMGMQPPPPPGPGAPGEIPLPPSAAPEGV